MSEPVAIIISAVISAAMSLIVCIITVYQPFKNQEGTTTQPPTAVVGTGTRPSISLSLANYPGLLKKVLIVFIVSLAVCLFFTRGLFVPKVSLTSLEIFRTNGNSTNYVITDEQNHKEENDETIGNTGQTFQSLISFQRSCFIEYFLDSKYRSFQAVICPSQGARYNANTFSSRRGKSSAIVIIKTTDSGDSEAIYESNNISAYSETMEVGPLNISDACYLRIVYVGSSLEPNIILGNPLLKSK